MKKKNTHELLLNLKDYNNKNIVTGLKVEFKRKDKIYIKDLYCIMNKDMRNNIIMVDNIQFFYLKENYKFNHKVMTVDFSKAAYKTFTNFFRIL